MSLQDIFKKHGISIYNEDGTIRNAVQIIEDMYLKLNTIELKSIFFEIEEEEKYSDLFKY